MKPIKVSDFLNILKNDVEKKFHDIFIEGEISNLSKSKTSHWYFSLSDESGLINCALFAGEAIRNPLISKVKNGDKVWISGSLSVYSARGTIQIIVKKISAQGEGFLKKQFEELKSKLASEGLFDLDHKKLIPRYPNRIAIVTALRGAALQDFLNVMKRRVHWVELVLVDALVQGEQAPSSLIKALQKIEKIKDIDLILFTRGGGSLEDLWAFNNENLVRAIYQCEIPIISAVGHQVDFTLTDFVADLRCETPSAAAEIISEPQRYIEQSLNEQKNKLKNIIKQKEQQVVRWNSLYNLSYFKAKILYRIKCYQEKLINPVDTMSSLWLAPELRFRLDDTWQKISSIMQNKISDRNNSLSQIDGYLKAFNPKKVLRRGYSYVQSKDKLISSLENWNSLKEGEHLSLSFYDGTVEIKK